MGLNETRKFSNRFSGFVLQEDMAEISENSISSEGNDYQEKR